MDVYIYAKQKQPGCKKSARSIRSHNGYKRPKTLISSKAKKLNIFLRINDIQYFIGHFHNYDFMALSLGHLTKDNGTKRWPSDKANHA